MSPLTVEEEHRLRRLLAQVQAEVNSRVGYRSDPELYRRPEFWTEAEREGDCEDYALAKRKVLLAAGFPSERLALAVCLTETGEGHAVLLAELDGTHVLDNRQDAVTPWRALPYRWIERQRAGTNLWEACG